MLNFTAPILILRNDVAGSNARFFDRTWAQYRNWFGNQTLHYWIGLDALHNLTSSNNCSIRFDLQLVNGSRYYAQYSSFSVGSLSTHYRLTIGGYSGNLEDAMAFSDNQKFSTYDSDNDGYRGACAREEGGGFWFKNCAMARLTYSPAGQFMWRSSKPPYVPYYFLDSVEARLSC